MHPACALLFLQLHSAPAQESDPYQRRITAEVQVVQKVAPSVVYITTEGPEMRMRDIWGYLRSGKQMGSGSGVVINEDGYIVTNYHVVRGAEKGNIRVAFDPTYDVEGRGFEAQLISYEPTEDLALLKISGDAPFPTIVMGTSSDLMIAERVLAIGNPYGQTHTVSTGIISGLHRDVTVADPSGAALRFEDLIQTDAAINPGNSGGALVNINGELIGINTVMNVQAENIGFAIPVDRVRRVLQDRLLSPSLARAWLGVDVDLESLDVDQVSPGSPADRAGIRVGDRLLRIDGKPVTTSEDYRLKRLDIRPYQSVHLALLRGGAEFEVDVETWDRVRGLIFTRLGVEVEELKISHGWSTLSRLRLSAVREDGPAGKLGLQAGDIIEAVTPEGGRIAQPQSAAELAILVNQLDPGATIEIDLWRDMDEDGRLERDAQYSELYQGPLQLD